MVIEGGEATAENSFVSSAMGNKHSMPQIERNTLGCAECYFDQGHCSPEMSTAKL